MKSFLQFLNESKIDLNQLYFHGSAKEKMTKVEKPSFEHPFYVTADIDYAMAFSTKTRSSTGHSENSIQFSKTKDNNYVYIMLLNPNAEFIDIRDIKNTEFDELSKVLPPYIVERLNKVAEKSYTDRKFIAHVDGIGNDIWYIFDIIRNTVVCSLQTNYKSKLFNKRYFLEILRMSSDYRLVEGKVKTLKNAIISAYSNAIPRDQRETLSFEMYKNEILSTQRPPNGIDVNTNTSFYEKLIKFIDSYTTTYKTDNELAKEIALGAYKIFREVKDNPDMSNDFKSITEAIGAVAKSMRSYIDKAEIDSQFEKLDDKQKTSIYDRRLMFNKLSYSSGTATLYSNGNIPEEEIAKLDAAIQSDPFLANIDRNITTHQLMQHYFELLHKKGYVGVITGEHDSNEDTGRSVKTNHAIGIWDIKGLNSVTMIPLKYRWLKKIMADDKNNSASAQEKYINT